MTNPYKYPGTAILRAMMDETGYTEKQTAAYLGVPLPTLMNWLAERREMPYLAERMLAVLGCMRALAPDLHAHFTPPDPKPDMREKANWTDEEWAVRRDALRARRREARP